jgi:hypothetical protein
MEGCGRTLPILRAYLGHIFIVMPKISCRVLIFKFPESSFSNEGRPVRIDEQGGIFGGKRLICFFLSQVLGGHFVFEEEVDPHLVGSNQGDKG